MEKIGKQLNDLKDLASRPVLTIDDLASPTCRPPRAKKMPSLVFKRDAADITADDFNDNLCELIAAQHLSNRLLSEIVTALKGIADATFRNS